MPKKTMDISKPGQSEPEATSRPVIVTHRPMVQDPMMKDESSSNTTMEPVKKAEPVHNKVIEPLSSGIVNTNEEPEVEPANTEAVTPDTQPESSEAATIDAVASQADPGRKRKEGELSPEEIAKQESIKKLVAEKKYFVPIGQVRHKHNQRVTIVVVIILLLAAAGAYYALDAGLIDLGIQLPLDLIKT